MTLPDGAYLAWRCADHGRVYWEDGRVDATDGPLCRFDAAQVAEAKTAALGLARATAPEPGSDTTTVVYQWCVDGRSGRFTYAFPPEPPAVQALEQRLAVLEEAAGGWPLLADD